MDLQIPATFLGLTGPLDFAASLRQQRDPEFRVNSGGDLLQNAGFATDVTVER